MAQKINPISQKLGLIQVWQNTIQNYGKLSINYFFILQRQLQISKFLVQVFDSNFFLLAGKELFYKQNTFFFTIYYSTLLNTKFDYVFLLTNFIKTVKGYLGDNLYIRFYLKLNWYSTTYLLTKYFQYLLKQNTSTAKTLWLICQFLEKNLNSVKILYLKNGPTKVILKGFKIKLGGRFINSRNQMAKNIEQSVGHSPLINLINHVEFLSTEIFTKLGTCGLRIWLFYEIDKL